MIFRGGAAGARTAGVAVLLAWAVALAVPSSALGQTGSAPGLGPGPASDVQLLGRRHGVEPPGAFFATVDADPAAFRFSRAWFGRNPRLDPDRPGELLPLPSGDGTMADLLGPRAGGVAGTLNLPLLLGYFSDTGGAPFMDAAEIQREIFDGPTARYGTLTDYYTEVSRGRLLVEGTTLPWTRSTLSQDQTAGGVSGLSPGEARVGQFIRSLILAPENGSVDWGQFDNDGPDGIPNSGDDDGFVDVLAVFHPTSGAECTGADNRIWSHRWQLASWLGQPVATSTPSANGGVVQVNDYVIQPFLNCEGDGFNDIGVLAHELGHGLGLPDLYCTSAACGAAGIGTWGLMGIGAWGCDDSDPEFPCHMSAWSKSMLGWADVVDLPEDTDLGATTLAPVISSGTVFRYRIPGTQEYFLLENRQPEGFDRNLLAGGLLIWRVDEELVEQAWPWNRVNADPSRYGVALMEADGLGELQSTVGNRGDGGDAFLPDSDRGDFHAATLPAAVARDGRVSGLTVTGLTALGTDLVMDLRTDFLPVRVTTQGDGGTASLITVNQLPLPAGGGEYPAAPFETVVVESAGGEVVEEGVRIPFVGWSDGEASPERSLVLVDGGAELTALFQGRQVQVDVQLAGERFGVAPGTILSEPASRGLWFPEGTAVTLTARATPGFAFAGWTVALAGAPNPVGLVVDGPLSAGASFDYTFAATPQDPVRLAAGDSVVVSIPVEGGAGGLTWRVVGGELPAGMRITEAGVAGVPLVPGDYAVSLLVEDVQGLQATAQLDFRVGVPDLPLERLAGTLLRNGLRPSPGQQAYLDRAGNGNGRLDVGDVRAYQLRRAQGGEVVTPATATVEPRLIPVRLLPVAPEGGSR